MANKTIPDYPIAGGIDATSDQFLLWQNSTNTYRKINRNTIMGVAGQPVDTSTAQSISNKSIGNTNTVTLQDNLFTLQDNSDTSKQAQFQLSGITTATTRTYTLPDASSTLADLSTSQTFTNKTFTSPVITGGSISNTSISVDSISEFTSANGVTVDGLNIKDGKLNSNNSVVTANVTDGSITPAKLQSGTGSGWSWSSWTPTFTNATIGNGTLTAFYVQTGKTVTFRLRWLLGSTSAVTGSIAFTLPVTANSGYIGTEGSILGIAKMVDIGLAEYASGLQFKTASQAEFFFYGSAGSYANYVFATASIPGTWGNGDELWAVGTYEAA